MPYVSKMNRKKCLENRFCTAGNCLDGDDFFVMSNFPAETSSKQSGVVVEVVKTVFKVSPKQPDLFNNLTTIVRKCGHAFEYLVLGVLLLNMLRQFWSAKRKKS